MSCSSKSWSPTWQKEDTLLDKETEANTTLSLSAQLDLDNSELTQPCFRFSRLESGLKTG